MSIELDEELARHFPGDTAFDELMAWRRGSAL